MHFGREDNDLTRFEPQLPADSSLTTATLANSAGNTSFKAYVGAPKWGYKHWKGKFYRKEIADADMLREYALQFNTVEFSSSFYQLVSDQQMTGWKEMVKDTLDFKFCPKFPQSISHIRRFRNVQEITEKFLQSVSIFEQYLGALLLQLPDNFTPNTFNDLKSYLATLPNDVRLFLEVRNKKWFEVPEYRGKLFDLLKDLNIGAAISDTVGRRDCLHMELTTPHAFIRFVNSGDEVLDCRRLDEWVVRLKDWKQNGLQSLYFFIHAGDTPSILLFEHFIGKLNSEMGTNIKVPQKLKDL